MTMEAVPPITGPRRVARSIGKGFKTFGRGIREAGAGFTEGLEVPRRPSARETGKIARGIFDVVTDITFRDEEYFWGDWDRPRKPRKPTSRLSSEVQSTLVSCLGEFHPGIYMSIWHPGMKYSEFIGTLRQDFPDIYEEMRDYAHSLARPRHGAPSYEEEYPY